MASLNKCIFIGNLGKDPEVRTTPSGAKVANFSLALTEKFKDQQGQQQEKTEWVNIVAWNALADIAQKYLRKGKQVLIEGVVQNTTWETPEGQKRFKTEFKAKTLLMLGKKDQQPQNNYESSSYDEPPYYDEGDFGGNY
jgi:single-strand DNA-binding protein